MSNLLEHASLIITPNAYKAGKIYSLKPTSGAGDLTFVRAGVKRVRNAAGNWVEIAANVPPLNYPVGVGCPSWLIEPQATNSIRNSEGVGAVVGTPGTLPANWEQPSSSLSRQIIGQGTEQGLPYLDIRFFGIASAPNHQIAFEAPNVIAASPSQIWTNSVFVRIISQPLPPTSYELVIREALNDGTFVSNGSFTIVPTILLARFSQTRTNTGGTTQRIQSRILLTTTIGVSYDFTIRIAVPQMELGSVATSPIITAGSALTRIADVPRLTGASALIGQTEGVIYIEAQLHGQSFSDNNVRALFSLSADSSAGSDRIAVFRFNNTIQYENVVGGVTQFSGAVFTLTDFTGQPIKIAISYTLNNVKVFINGVLRNTDVTALIPASSLFNLGCSRTGVAQYNGLIRPAILYPTLLTDAECIALTTI